jgi:hypothetical protein
MIAVPSDKGSLTQPDEEAYPVVAGSFAPSPKPTLSACIF